MSVGTGTVPGPEGRKERDPLCCQMYSGPWWQEGRESGSRKSDSDVPRSEKQNFPRFLKKTMET